MRAGNCHCERSRESVFHYSKGQQTLRHRRDDSRIRMLLDTEAGLSYAVGHHSRMNQKVAMATAAEAGMVSTHAQMMRLATPQRTAESRCVVPTPTIAPVMVCVVLTGIPASAVPNSVIAPAASAQKPPTGFSLVIFAPMVCTMRHPPK